MRKCLNSIVKQLNNRIEVIIINDGSTDNSLDILNEYSKKYSQLKIYDKPNEGVSSSRNIGLKVACGRYVTFVDSDDYIENDYIEKIFFNIDKMDSTGLDLMIFGFYRREDAIGFPNQPFSRESQNDIIRDILLQKYNAPWNKIFRKSIIDTYNVKFPVSMKTSEDIYFLLDFVKYIHGVGIADECQIYNYYDNPNGTVKNVKEQYLIDTIKVYHKIQSNICERTVECMEGIENSVMNRYYYIIYTLLKSQCNKKSLRLILNELNADLKQMTTLDWKNRIKRFLVSHQLFIVIGRSIKE